MAGADAFDWDDVVEISVFCFVTLCLVDIVQNVFPRSFTAGESFLLSALLVQVIRWIGGPTGADIKGHPGGYTNRPKYVSD